jgi:hypothetical protein
MRTNPERKRPSRRPKGKLESDARMAREQAICENMYWIHFTHDTSGFGISLAQ